MAAVQDTPAYAWENSNGNRHSTTRAVPRRLTETMKARHIAQNGMGFVAIMRRLRIGVGAK